MFRHFIRPALYVAISLAALLFFNSSAIRAATVVTFETIPGGAPADGLPISDQFPNATFSLEGGGFPVLAEVGGAATGFFGPPGQTSSDSAAGGAGIGNFFLTDDGIINSAPRVVVITLLRGANAASGDILDVDNGEIWTAEVRDKNGAPLESKTFAAGDANTGDGIATTFSFLRQNNDIHSIRFLYSGSDPSSGFGFDNLTASAVPLPAAVWAGGAMLVGMAAMKKGRKMIVARA